MNYISQPLTPKVTSRLIGKIKVPTGGLTPGSVVFADSLDGSIPGNIEVFTATKPITSNLGGTSLALVLNDGFETLDDGRRPAGDPNYYKYVYGAGSVAPVLFLDEHLRVNIGLDSINQETLNLAIIGNYLIPTNDSYLLSASNTLPDNVGVGLKIVALMNTPLGGNFGTNSALSLVCVPTIDNAIDTGNYFFTYSLPNQVGGTTINQTDGTITLSVGSGLTGLVATFTNSRDAVVKVGGVTQTSGQTSNNFTSPVTYTVTSEKGVAKTYVVTATSVLYSITPNLTNCTGDETNPTTIVLGETKTLKFVANDGYVLPDTVTVTGADSTWDVETGTLVLSNPTGAVSVTVTANEITE